MVPGGPEEVEPDDMLSERHVGQSMKQFTIEVSHANPGQLQTIAAELKIMSNGWAKFGPRITINNKKLQALELRVPRGKHQATSRKHQATSHNITTFI